MPYIQARFSKSLDETQKNEIQTKLTKLVSAGLSKPETYIMTEIADGCDLYIASSKVENGAYISVKLLGTTNKGACSPLTQNICNTLSADLGLDSSKIYITYHPVDLWGWNGMMF